MRFEKSLSTKVEITGFCWLWTASNTGYAEQGQPYGQVWNGERVELAHRWVYRNLVGAIPQGYNLDHLCRVRLCVNPDHLEPVTSKVNTNRGGHSFRGLKTSCIRGHDMTDAANIHVVQRGKRKGSLRCKACIKFHNDKKKEAL